MMSLSSWLLPRFVLRIHERLDDHLSPILVKELRQALRAKVVMACQFLMLAALLVIMGIALLYPDPGQENGGNFAVSIQCVLMIVCAGMVPFYTGVRLALERHDTARDLLYVTTLSPRAIILGKWVSGLCLGGVCFCGALPFFVLCAFLPGVDIRGVILCVGVDVAALMVGTALTVFMGALGQGWILRLMLGLVYLGAAGLAVAGGTALGITTIAQGRFRADEVFVALPCLVGVGLWVGGLALVLAMSCVAPEASNRARGPRRYLAISMAGSAGLVLGGWIFLGLDKDFVTGWVGCWAVLLSFYSLLAVSEPDKLGARIRRWLPAGGLARAGQFLFCSGAAQALSFVIVLWGFLAAVCAVPVCFSQPRAVWPLFSTGGNIFSHNGAWDIAGLLAMPAMVFFYALLGNLVRRWLFPRARPMVGAMIGVGLGVFGSLGPPIAALMFARGSMQDMRVAVLCANPFGLFAMASSDRATLGLTWLVGLPVGILMLLLAQRGWLMGQVSEFTPWAEECCSHCGYDLRGSLGTGRCPECGAPISPEAQAAARRLAGG